MKSFAERNRFGRVGRIPSPTLLGVGDITGLQALEEKARVEDGRITEYLVTMQVIFILEEPRA
jgi:hypothetical protein